MKTKYIILGIILTIFIVGCQTTGNTVKDVESNEDDFIKIPLSEVTSTIQKFNHGKVRFMVVLGSDGEVRTAFDGCDICGGKKGYRQQGTDVACINCGKVFRIDDIGTLNSPGGCWPSFLDHKIEDGNVLVSKSELERGAFRF